MLVWKGRAGKNLFGTAGYADREAKRPFTRDTLGGRSSEPVTGVALIMLWEQGRSSTSKYLPDVKVFAGTDPAGKPIVRAPSRPIVRSTTSCVTPQAS